MDEVWNMKNLGVSEGGKGGVKCVGHGCRLREQPRSGNRSCSNGRSCKSCCERAQKNGSPTCSYSSHNSPPFSIGGGLVSSIPKAFILDRYDQMPYNYSCGSVGHYCRWKCSTVGPIGPPKSSLPSHHSVTSFFRRSQTWFP